MSFLTEGIKLKQSGNSIMLLPLIIQTSRKTGLMKVDPTNINYLVCFHYTPNIKPS